ncbi:MAG: M23 family metallopeptidase [Salinarimonadaceae bacterium]|nr:MAG: M23 family metallopeptidase [Salinarimonadaceae bacterium]
MAQDIHTSGSKAGAPRNRVARDAQLDFEAAIGLEPPLDLKGETQAESARRGVVNLRWLCGSVLTALTGSALLGAAIYVAVEGGSTVVELPKAATVEAPALDAGRETARKEDMLVRTDYTVAARSTFRTPVATRVGDREVVSIRGFTRIATNLSQTSGRYATDIPRFDPLRLMAGDSVERVAEEAPRIEEAEVSFRKRALSGADPAAAVSPALTDEEAAAQVAEELTLLRRSGARSVAALPAQTFLSRTLGPRSFGDVSAFAQSTAEPFNAIDVQVIPENVSTVAKLRRRPVDGLVEELALTLPPGGSLQEVLNGQGLAPDRVEAAVAAIGGDAALGDIPAGLAVRALVEPGARPGDPRRLLRVVAYGENGVVAVAAADDAGRFAPVDFRDESGVQAATAVEDEAGGSSRAGARLFESLYETAYKHGLSRALVEDLVKIFAYDLDFQRRVGLGDSIDLFMTAEEGETPELLSAAITIGGQTSRVYRFHSPDDGAIEYFDPDGRSLKKFLMRTPIAEGRMTSGFGMRRHPILRYARMHTGVDWAARTGTPIFAAGNGRVIKAEWSGGYGRRIEIQHTNGYVTTYSHMSRFASGIQAGTRVTQGQVIGYVGNTGLSTGPHLHYEVLVNGKFVDPLKIRVPRSRELDGRALAEFQSQRQQIDQLIEKAGGPTRLAQNVSR